jgi:hypothetical protein
MKRSEMRNLTSSRKIEEFIYIIPDTHLNLKYFL